MELISECFVKAMHKIEASKSRIYLNPTDLRLLQINASPRGVLYTLDQPSSKLPDLLDNLKRSLSIALVHFYPLSGRFVTETFLEEHACAVSIDCNKGPGANLTHVVASNVIVSDIVSPVGVPAIVGKFFDLGENYVNYDGHTKPLLSIQVTELVDGVFIGFTLNHCVVDGISFMHFLRMLSEIYCLNDYRGEKLLRISEEPIYEHGPMIKLPYLGLEKVITRREIIPLVDRVFNFSSKSLAMIKAKVNQERSISNVSSFQGLTSLIWRSITRARNLSSDEETTCYVAISPRPRFDPPRPDQYFGNHVYLIKVTCTVGELLSHDWAAKRFNELINAQDDKCIKKSLNLLADQVTKPDFFNPGAKPIGSNIVAMGGSTRFDLYGLEFGLGKARKALMGLGNVDGRVMASQSRDGGDNFNIDMQISLRQDCMAALEADNEFMALVSQNNE